MPLDGVLHVALRPQVLLVGAVLPEMSGAVAAHGEEAFPGDDLPLQQALAELHQVAPGGEKSRVSAGVGEQSRGLWVMGEARFRPAEDVLPPLDAVLPVAGHAQVTQLRRHHAVGVRHPQGDQNALLQQLGVPLPCRPLDDVAQHHGVHVRVGAARHFSRLDGVQQPQRLLRGGGSVHAARGGQAHLKAQDGVHAHLVQMGELGRVVRDGTGEIQLALGVQPHDEQPREQLGQAGQVEDGILREGDVFCCIRESAVGREGAIRRAAGHAEARHNARFLREIGDGRLQGHGGSPPLFCDDCITNYHRVAKIITDWQRLACIITPPVVSW